MRDAVVVGKEQRNYGLLDITAEAQEIRLFKANVQESLLYRKLSRATWLLV